MALDKEEDVYSSYLKYEWSKFSVSDKPVDAVFLGSWKTFERVPFMRFMKIEKFGISGNLLKWIKGF